MKTSLTLMIAALALTGTLGQASTSGSAMSTDTDADSTAMGDCDFGKSSFLGDVAQLLPLATQCEEKSGFGFLPPNKLPTDEETAKICTECSKLINEAANFSSWPDCEFDIDGKKMSVSEFFQKFADDCGSASGSTDATTGSDEDASAGESASTGSGSDGAATITVTALAGLTTAVTALAL